MVILVEVLEPVLRIAFAIIIGISATSYYIPQVKEITEFLRSKHKNNSLIHPNIILGGYISIIPDVIKQTGVDVVCLREGDFTILELMDYSKTSTCHFTVPFFNTVYSLYRSYGNTVCSEFYHIYSMPTH